jgi:hypothetical protein
MDTKTSLVCLILINRTSLDTIHSCVLSLSHVITRLISLFGLSLWGNYLCPPNLNSDLPPQALYRESPESHPIQERGWLRG